MTDLGPVSITQMRRPIFDLLGAAKNRRAPAGRWEQQRRWERGRLGRINPTTDRRACFNHANQSPEHPPAGCGQECPRSYRRVGGNNGVGSAAVSAASTG
ncbi:MAG: hypothetical protein GX456_03430 [Verrucomicrobia bacterium]|nr:hypothetical protein [Verrucomicrobiota bacterium]